MPTPAWIAATAGQPPLAAQINQLLGTHAATYLYAGAQQGGHTTLGSGAPASNGLYIAQSFTAPSSFSLGRIVLWLSLTGAPPATTISIQTSSGGAPSGAALVSTVLPAGFAPGTAAAVSVPVPCTLTSGAGYWIVLTAAGDASDYFAWSKSDQASGASTSSNGSTWAAQTYGLYYSYWDQSAIAPLAHTWEDGGARWAGFAWSAAMQPTVIDECTVGQGAGQYLSSQRALSYTTNTQAGPVLSTIT